MVGAVLTGKGAAPVSRVYRVESWADGDELCVDQVNAELDSLVGEMNGHIDVDNIPAGIVTGAKVEVDAFNGIVDETAAGPTSVVFNGGAAQGWEVLLTSSLTTEDGYVEVEGQATYDLPNAAGTHVEVGVRIDGRIAARSAASGWYESDSLACFGLCPVGPGAHVVELVVHVNPGEYDTAPADVTCTVNAQALWARFVAR